MLIRKWATIVSTLKRWPSWYAPGLIGFTLFLTWVFWITSKIAQQGWFENHWLYFSKTCALSASILMGWLLLLTTRAIWTERLCNGLDRVYLLHRALGVLVTILIFLHPFFLSLNRWPSLRKMFLFFVIPYPHFKSLYQIGANLGAWTFLALILLAFLAVKKINPYRKWLSIHRCMVGIYLLSAVHIFLVERDVARYYALFFWLWGWLLLGGVALVWNWLYPWLGPKTVYKIEKITNYAHLIELHLKAEKAPLEFKPGQWAFLKIPSLPQGKELHPFSLMSIPNKEGILRFGIKITGKWTHNLIDVGLNEPVYVYGPHGMLSDAFLTSPRDCVLIGAGIGITPFISMWEWALHTPNRFPGKPELPASSSWENSLKYWPSPRVHLLYIAPSIKEAVFTDLIERITINQQFRKGVVCSQLGHRFDLILTKSGTAPVNAETIHQLAGDLKEKTILMCGPVKMIHSLKSQFLKMGVSKKQIFYEVFDWRKSLF